MAIRFKDESALVLALSSGWVPSEVSAAPAKLVRQKTALVIEPSVAFSKKSLGVLARHGGEECSLPKSPSTLDLLAWPEAVGIQRNMTAGLDAGSVVFLIPSSVSFAETAAEILRLGCDRQEYRVVGDRVLLRVVAPPFHALGRALDKQSGVRAYRAVSDKVYVELGYDHPTAATLKVSAPETVLFIGVEGWEVISEGTFEDLLAKVDLAVNASPEPVKPSLEVPRISVPLRLSRAARRSDASLWMIKTEGSHTGASELEKLVRSVPDSVTAQYLFTIASDGRAFLRARRDGKNVSEPSVTAEAFSAHPQIPHLFLPADRIIEPPIRHEKLAQLVAPDASKLSLVTKDGFLVERLSADAFKPLSEFVDYLVDMGAPVLESWVRGATFSFPAFTAREERPARDDRDDEPEEKKSKKKSRVSVLEDEPEERPVERVKRPVAAAIEVVSVPVSKAAAELAKREAEFLASSEPAGSPERTQMWAAMASLNATLSRPREASHGFVRACWETGESSFAEGWAKAEGRPSSLTKLLAKEHASSEEVRSVAAEIIATQAASVTDAGAASRFFDRHDTAIDIRSMWLARFALSTKAKDKLMLARARDRALTRLSQGLSIERDVPSFMRFLGQSREPQNVDRLSTELEGLLTRALGTARSKSAVESKPELTNAYVELALSYGFARLGASDRARGLCTGAVKKLDVKDPVHGFLTRAYAARVEQALAGESAQAPLPPAVNAELNSMERFLRYKVDRIRQSSVLEPIERIDPIGAFQRSDTDARGAAFAPLRAETDPDVLAKALEEILKAKAASVEDSARMHDGVLDFLPRLSAPRAIAMVERVMKTARGMDVPPLVKAQLFEKSLRVAGHFGETGLVREILEAIQPLIKDTTERDAGGLAELLGGAVRALRRVGLHDDTAALLAAAGKVAKGDGIPAAVARVQVASGFAMLGQDEKAVPLFETAMAKIAGELTVPDRLTLTKAIARGVSSCKQDFAFTVLRKLEEHYVKVTDSYNTNSHFCLSAVSFIESLVLGYVSDDLALGEAGRRFLDEDEHLVRRRIHRDVRGS